MSPDGQGRQTVGGRTGKTPTKKNNKSGIGGTEGVSFETGVSVRRGVKGQHLVTCRDNGRRGSDLVFEEHLSFTFIARPK